MYKVRVIYRGHDLAVHVVDTRAEALDLMRVYRLLGYDDDKIVLDAPESENADLRVA